MIFLALLAVMIAVECFARGRRQHDREGGAIAAIGTLAWVSFTALFCFVGLAKALHILGRALCFSIALPVVMIAISLFRSAKRSK